MMEGGIWKEEGEVEEAGWEVLQAKFRGIGFERGVEEGRLRSAQERFDRAFVSQFEKQFMVGQLVGMVTALEVLGLGGEGEGRTMAGLKCDPELLAKLKEERDRLNRALSSRHDHDTSPAARVIEEEMIKNSRSLDFLNEISKIVIPKPEIQSGYSLPPGLIVEKTKVYSVISIQ